MGRLSCEFVERLAVPEKLDRSNRHSRSLEIEGNPRSAGRGDEPPPVGISTVDGSFDERRIRDGSRRAVSICAAVAPETRMVTSFVAPSPPRTISTARCRHTVRNPSTNVGYKRAV